MRQVARQLTPALLVCSTLIVVGTVALSHRTVSSVHAASVDMGENLGPAVERLAEISLEAARLRQVLESRLRTPDQPLDRTAIVASLSKLSAALQRYLETPTWPGETAFWRELEQAMLDVHRATASVLARQEMGAREEAASEFEQTLGPALERLSDVAERDLAFNVENGRRSSSALAAARTESSWLAGLLGLASLAVLSAALAHLFLQTRRHAELIAGHAAAIERHRNELELFAGTVAQDVLRPLGSLTMCHDVLLSRLEDQHEARRILELGTKSAHRIREIICDVLDYAKADECASPEAEAEVRALLERLVAEFATNSEGPEVKLDPLGFDALSVDCAPNLFIRIALGLIRGGATLSEGGALHVFAEPRGPMLRLGVRSFGPSLPRDLVASLFDPFVRTPGVTRPAAGLSLATVRKLVESRGGTRGADSRLGEGTVLWIELPQSRGRRRGPRVAA
jgi:signal transduction histidine kinase